MSNHDQEWQVYLENLSLIAVMDPSLFKFNLPRPMKGYKAQTFDSYQCNRYYSRYQNKNSVSRHENKTHNDCELVAKNYPQLLFNDPKKKLTIPMCTLCLGKDYKECAKSEYMAYFIHVVCVHTDAEL